MFRPRYGCLKIQIGLYTTNKNKKSKNISNWLMIVT